jgi:hypothetical protein
LHEAKLRLKRRALSVALAETPKDHDEAQPGHHHHLALSDHWHAPDDPSVVYVQQDASVLSGGELNALPRSVHDLDGLFFGLLLPHAAAAAGPWHAGAPNGFRSHVTSPPERPPRA